MALLDFVGSALGCLWRERRYGRDELHAHRDRRLAALVAHAQATTPLWRDRLANIDASRPVNLAQIKPITKDELMARFGDSIADGAVTLAELEAHTRSPRQIGKLYRGEYMVATTSGTTGRIGYFVTDRRAWAALNGALFARILRHRLIPSEILRFSYGRRYRMAMTIATEGHFITRLVSTFRPTLTRAMVDMRAFSVMTSLDRTVGELNRFRPHYLHSYPTYLEALAHQKLSGALVIEPEFISLGSEPVSEHARHAIRRAFPTAEVSETYGATECLVMANQCRFGGLHVNEDLCILEPVDRLGRPVPVGTPSDKVYVTNLLNRAQPLLRYELADSVTVLGGECPCGSVMPRIRVEGRSDDTFFFADRTGRYQAHPPIPFETLFLDLPGLAQYQLVHEAQNHLVVRFVPEPGADASTVAKSLVERFRAYLASHELSDCVRVALEPVPRLEREPGGHKLRQVYSKVPRPAVAV
ncbi:AMP-binding protein [Myxococcota bacterium]|nr:AMP-binding protein [Myxococcota bacterium]